MKYRNRIPEPGTTISSFADNKTKINKKLMPTDPRYFCHVTVNTHIFLFGLTCEKNILALQGKTAPSSQVK
jgi:hypothetical protein